MAHTEIDHPRCGCGLPAVCFGADLGAPQWRCPRCCHRDHLVDTHGPVDYLAAHMAAEGTAIPGVPDYR